MHKEALQIKDKISTAESFQNKPIESVEKIRGHSTNYSRNACSIRLAF